MGNYLLLGSASYGVGVAAYKKLYLPRFPIYDEYIEHVEERCVDLSNPLRHKNAARRFTNRSA